MINAGGTNISAGLNNRRESEVSELRTSQRETVAPVVAVMLQQPDRLDCLPTAHLIRDECFPSSRGGESNPFELKGLQHCAKGFVDVQVCVAAVASRGHNPLEKSLYTCADLCKLTLHAFVIEELIPFTRKFGSSSMWIERPKSDDCSFETISSYI